MTAEFWRDLTPQDELEAQYAALMQGWDSHHDTAIHLARYAEARIYTKAAARIEELERQVRALRSG